MNIADIKGREILDSRGTPTVEVEILLSNGIRGHAAVPSGASTGENEALELRDMDKRRYNGKGVQKAVENIRTKIAPRLKGMCVFNQREIDHAMIELDNSDNSPGWKFAEYEMKGVPVRIELGPRDIENGQCVTVTRHNREKEFVSLDGLADTIKARNITWVGIESAPQMKRYYRADGELEICDALGYDFQPFDLAVCFLSLMFFPKDKRRDWLVKLIEKAKFGGAVIVVDKEEPKGGVLSTALHRFIMSSKAKTTPAEQIMAKEFSLGGIQRPLARDSLQSFGATEIFRCGDFAAWVIEKKW